MNDIQAEHDDHDDLGEDTNNDHRSDGNDSDDGNHSGDNGGGARVREGANNDRDGGDGNNDSNNDSNGGDDDGDNDGNGGDGNNDGNNDGGGGGEGGIGYADAMAELEQILRDLEGDDLDVDMLASRVERASLLIGLCRTRIGAARVQVERVVATLDSGDDKYGIEAGSEAGN